MTFKDAYRDDLENAFFDAEEFASVHNIDGENYTVVIMTRKSQDAHMSYGLMKATLNPKEAATNKHSFVLYIKDTDVKRKFSVNALISVDGRKLFIYDVKHIEGVFRLVIGEHAM